MDLKAAIFDLNGTVLADEFVYGRAFKSVLESLGAEVNEDYPHEGGIGVEENWPKLISKYDISTDKTVDELTVLTQEKYLSLLDEVDIKKGFVDLAEELRRNGIRVALATSNTWGIVERVFDKFDIELLFDVVTTAEEVEIKKPDPSLFIISARKLDMERSSCIVFEDSESGIVAAKHAGMVAVGVFRDGDHAKELMGADVLIADFDEFDFEAFFRR